MVPLPLGAAILDIDTSAPRLVRRGASRIWRTARHQVVTRRSRAHGGDGWRTAPGEAAAVDVCRRAMEKAGLRLVRTFHTPWTGHPIEGAEQGEVEYALGRSDWEQREAADSHQWPSQTSADRTR